MISTIKTTVIAAGISFAVGAVSAWWVTADYKNAKHEAIISKIRLDAADALAVAVCHAHSFSTKMRLAEQSARPRLPK